MGATIGAIVGGYAGEPITGGIDTAAEIAYWREHFDQRPYAGQGPHFEQFEPAYRQAMAVHGRHPAHAFDDIEPLLSRDWLAARGASTLDWDRARDAARDAWERLTGSAARHRLGD